jgi:signal transduction histidine kinase/CheY-like chemotaxis protein/CHASE3 domain sensor protein
VRRRPWPATNRIVVGLAVVLAVLVATALLQYASIDHLLDSSRRTSRLYAVLAKAEQVQGELHAAGSWAHGYLLSGNTRMLGQVEERINRVAPDLAEMQRLAVDDADQRRRLATLAPLIEVRVAALRRFLTLQRMAGPAPREMEADPAPAQAQRLESGIEALRAQALSRVNERERALAQGAKLTLAACGVGLSVALALLVLTVRASRRDLAQRIGAARMALEAKRLTAIIAAQNLIAADFRPERVRELLAQQACLITGAAGARIELESDGAEEGTGGFSRLAAGAVAAAPAVAVLDDDGRAVDAAGNAARMPPRIFARLGARSLVAVPLVCLGRRLGNLWVFSPEPVPFGAEAVGDLQLLAGFAAAALTHAAELSAKEAALREHRRAQETADAASGAKSEFLASMSHELRTPLNSIIGFSEILRDQRFGPLNARQARYVENVLSSGHHLLQLVNDVLDLSKVESGRMELRPVPIDLRETLGEAVAIVQSLAQTKQVEIDVSLPVLRPALVADQGKLKQVLYNLLSNAVKFTPNGGRVRVEAQSLAESAPALGGEHGMLLVSVVDNGIGIPERDQLRMFEAFEQADSPLARENPGTGLGLAVARKLVELHGGRIWVESAGNNHGSCFRFTLPLAAETPPPPPGKAALAGGRGAEARPLFAGGRSAPLVLVVEDDAGAREILRLCLRNAGYDVVEAADADEALAVARTARPQAVTLDLLLPKRDGWELLAELRSDPATHAIPVIVVSVTEDRLRAHTCGAQAVLVKPIDRELLVGLVRELTGWEWRAVRE